MMLVEALEPNKLVRRPTAKFISGEKEVWMATETILYRHVFNEKDVPLVVE